MKIITVGAYPCVRPIMPEIITGQAQGPAPTKNFYSAGVSNDKVFSGEKLTFI